VTGFTQTRTEGEVDQVGETIVENTKIAGDTTVGVVTNIADTVAGLGEQFWRPVDWTWQTGKDLVLSAKDFAYRVGKWGYDNLTEHS